MSVIDEVITRLPILHAKRLIAFLCHASQDKPEVMKLYEQLDVDGCDPWLDKKKLLPGQHWETEILKAITGSDVVVVCLSRQAGSKVGFIQKEIRCALDIADKQPHGTIFIIPAKLEPCELPDRLAQWQSVNLYEPDGYDMLLQAIRARTLSLQEPLRFATWQEAPVKIQDFSLALIDEIERVTSATTSMLLRLPEYPLRASSDAAFATALSERVARLDMDNSLDVDITCLDETGRYFIHSSCLKLISTSHENVWSNSQGPKFSPWFWKNVTEMQRGVLTWTDKLSGDPIVWNKYKRKTIVVFKRIAVAENIEWTVAVEGHEFARRVTR